MPPPSRLLTALRLLVDGHNYARDVGAPLSEFAVTIETLRRNSVAEIDVRWLIRKAYAVVVANADVVLSDDGDFSLQTSFVVSSSGLQFAQQLLDLPLEVSSTASEVPCWDNHRRELRLGTSVVKRFRVPAANQALVLRSFQEEGWPPHLVDPIPPARDIDPKRRLHDTILALNRGQLGPRIRFHGDGTGTGVLWEAEK